MGGSAYPLREARMNRRLLIIVGVLVGLAGITWAAYAWVHAQSHVSTDDAYVESAIAPLAAKVVGPRGQHDHRGQQARQGGRGAPAHRSA